MSSSSMLIALFACCRQSADADYGRDALSKKHWSLVSLLPAHALTLYKYAANIIYKFRHDAFVKGANINCADLQSFRYRKNAP